MDRILIPEDISLPEGYKIEVFAEKLTTPINLTRWRGVYSGVRQRSTGFYWGKTSSKSGSPNLSD